MVSSTTATAPGGNGGSGMVLRIVAGLHAGAARPLAQQEMLVVGSGDDCDIVLADTGVAAHHALVTLVGDTFTLRALDAPLRVEGKPLHPGDPAVVAPLQRIDLGEAAFAFGSENEAGWAALFPAVAGRPGASTRGSRWFPRLPAIAAVAALLVAAVALFAFVMPRRTPAPDPQAFMTQLIKQFHIAKARTATDVNGTPVLSGDIEDEATLKRIQQRVSASGIPVRLDLRTGQDIASDVRETLRGFGFAVQTRYKGNGDVYVIGDFSSESKLRAAAMSRTMQEVEGINHVIPVNNIVPTPDNPTGAAQGTAAAGGLFGPPADIVSVVHGEEPYVVDSKGNDYTIGAMIPGRGRLTLIGKGKSVAVQDTQGQISQLKIWTQEELAARDAAERQNAPQPVQDPQDSPRTPAPAPASPKTPPQAPVTPSGHSVNSSRTSVYATVSQSTTQEL